MPLSPISLDRKQVDSPDRLTTFRLQAIAERGWQLERVSTDNARSWSYEFVRQSSEAGVSA